MTLHTHDNRLVVNVDMDAVVADWGAQYDIELDKHGDAAKNIPRSHQQDAWDLKAGRTAAEKRIIDLAMNAPGFYRALSPIPGAVDAISALRERGHAVFFVTSPFLSNATCASDKLAWVAQHFGQTMAQRTIITHDKTAVRGDVLIDDKPTITGDLEPLWTRIVFGVYAYNAHVPGPRITDWVGCDYLAVIEQAVREQVDLEEAA